MAEVSAEALKQAVEAQHGGKAVLYYVARIREMIGKNLVWTGAVHVFDLEGNPNATRAYAWSSPVDGSDKRQLYAVLHLGKITSPVEAVRAVIGAEYCHGNGLNAS